MTPRETPTHQSTVNDFNRDVEQRSFWSANIGRRFVALRGVHKGQTVKCSDIRFGFVLPALDCHPLDAPEDWRTYDPFDLAEIIS